MSLIDTGENSTASVGIRTPNRRFRRPMLYPIELQTLEEKFCGTISEADFCVNIFIFELPGPYFSWRPARHCRSTLSANRTLYMFFQTRRIVRQQSCRSRVLAAALSSYFEGKMSHFQPQSRFWDDFYLLINTYQPVLGKHFKVQQIDRAVG